MRSVCIVLIAVTFCTVGCVSNASQPSSDRGAAGAARTVHTSGAATVYAQPDFANIRFSLHTFDRDLDKSKSQNDVACKQVVDFVHSLGVEDRDIQTQEMSSQRVEEEMPDRHKEFRGYTFTRDYAIVLRDLTRFQKLRDTLLVRSDCTIEGYTFGTSRSRELHDQARRQAVVAAAEKARLLASELHCSVGDPTNIDESVLLWATGAANSINHESQEDAGAPVDVVRLGQIEIDASVSVTFDLKPSNR